MPVDAPPQKRSVFTPRSRLTATDSEFNRVGVTEISRVNRAIAKDLLIVSFKSLIVGTVNQIHRFSSRSCRAKKQVHRQIGFGQRVTDAVDFSGRFDGLAEVSPKSAD